MGGRPLGQVDCVNCGQCAAVCPTGALTIKDETDKVWDEITNPNKIVVVQMAPATRVALGEMFGLPAGENTIGLMNAALRKIGFNLVFDTNFSADLTIMEEATEFLERLKSGKICRCLLLAVLRGLSILKQLILICFIIYQVVNLL